MSGNRGNQELTRSVASHSWLDCSISFTHVVKDAAWKLPLDLGRGRASQRSRDVTAAQVL